MKKSSTQTLKQSLAAALIAAIAALTATLATQHLAFLASLENIAADIRVAAFQRPMPQSKEIAVVAINEDTLSRFAYRSPVDRAFLASLLVQLEAKGAKAIGLDVLLDQPTEPAKDALLARVIRQLKIPLFISYTNTPGHVTEDQLNYLNQFVPKEFRASANLATDPFDGAVRWIFPGETGPEVPASFARVAISMMGRPMPPATQPAIAWRAAPDAETPPFPIYPAHAIAALPREWFENRLLLVGATLSITDRHRTPMAILYDDARGMMPGIVVQAHSISQLLEGRSAERPSGLFIFLFGLIFAAIGVAIGLLKRSIVFNFLMGITVLVVLWLGGVLGYTHGLPLVPLLAPSLALAVSLWMMDTFIGKAERKQKEFIQGAFSRYVSPAVVEQLVDNPAALSLTGRRQEASFLFTDIAGFTTLSEKLASDQLSDLLNAYLNGACEIIQKHQGTIDKFIGDAIMAVFNAPLPQTDHQERAVRCALDLDTYAERFRAAQNEKGIPLGVTRIGLHSGSATIGNFGSQSRMDFTALGDTVNIAARTEGANKFFGTRICCTRDIMQGCPDRLFLPIGEVVLKGKEKAVALFQPLHDSTHEQALVADYRTAYLGLAAHAPDSDQAFERLRAKYPENPLIEFYCERIRSGNRSTQIVMDEK